MRLYTTLLFTILSCISGVVSHAHERASAYSDNEITAKYVRPSGVSQETWEKVSPYLLPDDHPAKLFLDTTFSASRVIYDRQSMLDAGFHPTPVQGLRAIVMQHPNMPGYIIKTYLDSLPHSREDWSSWINRITGAELIRKMIVKNKWQSTFKVAHKWIYPLPDHPAPPEGSSGNHFILIVENMNLLPKKASIDKWYQLNSTKTLDAIYKILRSLGLRDCPRNSNLPWCHDGRLAFVDTESYNYRDIPYVNLNRRLNPQMLNYWKKLTKQ